MSDRYVLTVKCPYCESEEDNVWYAPGCGAYQNRCPECSKAYFIVDCECAPPEKTTPEMLLESFLGSLNVYCPTESDNAESVKRYKQEIADMITANSQLNSEEG